VLLGLAAGVALPVQAAVNARLSQASRNTVWTALASFSVGTVALVAYALVSAGKPPIAEMRNSPPWDYLGGVCGVFYIWATIALVPRLGSTLMFSAIVTGQMLASLGLDRIGFLGMPVHAFTIERVVGTALVVAGVIVVRVLAADPRQSGRAAGEYRAPLGLVGLAVAVGTVLPVQVSLNGQLGKQLGSATWATVISFAVGTIALVVLLLVGRGRIPSRHDLKTAPWWAWSGGILGAFYVWATITLVPRLGTAVLFSLIIAGQMLFSLAADSFGWLGISRRPFRGAVAAGALMVALGVMLIRTF